ncbi:uncharacterized protein NPIL_631521 [Nephila pilipes]|uniref:Gustatory receptor n=1 Tax=Nephila pilipes TaxID=299642 RepID=A0A8X6UAW4_NEPPI|nr:uncharacterized protein NPIL_631521 [Nephila pilipes]
MLPFIKPKHADKRKAKSQPRRLVCVRAKKQQVNVLTFYTKLLGLVGIFITDRLQENKLFKTLGMILFNSFWTIISYKHISSMMIQEKDLDLKIFIFLEHFSCFVLWWILFFKRFRIHECASYLHLLRIDLGIKSSPRYHFLVIAINTIVFCLCIINNLDIHEWSPHEIGESLGNNPQLSSVLHLIFDSADVLIHHGLPFITSLVYIVLCFEINQLLTRLSKICKKNLSNENMLWTSLLKATVRLENGMSMAIFIFLFRCLVEFLCTLTAIIDYLFGTFEEMYIAFFLLMAVMFSLIVSAADVVGKRHSDFKKYILKSILRKMKENHTHPNSTNNQYVLFLEIKEDDVSITAWKIFILDRRLLLSTTASLLTYGILLYQMK